MFEFAVLTSSAIQVFASSSSSDGDLGDFAFVFLLSGFVFYGIIYLRYRNTDKRHKHESETEASLHNLRAGDQLIKSLTGLSNSKMRGANNGAVNGLLRRFF